MARTSGASSSVKRTQAGRHALTQAVAFLLIYCGHVHMGSLAPFCRSRGREASKRAASRHSHRCEASRGCCTAGRTCGHSGELRVPLRPLRTWAVGELPSERTSCSGSDAAYTCQLGAYTSIRSFEYAWCSRYRRPQMRMHACAFAAGRVTLQWEGMGGSTRCLWTRSGSSASPTLSRRRSRS